MLSGDWAKLYHLIYEYKYKFLAVDIERSFRMYMRIVSYSGLVLDEDLQYQVPYS